MEKAAKKNKKMGGEGGVERGEVRESFPNIMIRKGVHAEYLRGKERIYMDGLMNPINVDDTVQISWPDDGWTVERWRKLNTYFDKFWFYLNSLDRLLEDTAALLTDIKQVGQSNRIAAAGAWILARETPAARRERVAEELTELHLAARKVLRRVAREREVVGNVVEQVSAIGEKALDALSLTWQSVERGGGKETLPEETVARITKLFTFIKFFAKKLRETIGERLLEWLSAEENGGGDGAAAKWWRDLDFKMTPWVDIETSGLGEALYLKREEALLNEPMSDKKLTALQGVVKKYREEHQRLGFNIVNALNNLAEPIEERRLRRAQQEEAAAAWERSEVRLAKIDEAANRRFGLEEREREERVHSPSDYGFDQRWPKLSNQ